MPASTAVHDLTLTLYNDTSSIVTVQVLRENSGQGANIFISIPPGEDVPLGVMSGTLYRYAVERNTVRTDIRKVEMS